MTRPSLHRNNFAKALKTIRKTRRLSQEAFGLASSRTHVSALERGIKKPALDTVEELAEVLDVHPLTLLTLSYMKASRTESVLALLEKVRNELGSLETL
jgi:transcriptional regulator with XRE-family HTH domain